MSKPLTLQVGQRVKQYICGACRSRVDWRGMRKATCNTCGAALSMSGKAKGYTVSGKTVEIMDTFHPDDWSGED